MLGVLRDRGLLRDEPVGARDRRGAAPHVMATPSRLVGVSARRRGRGAARAEPARDRFAGVPELEGAAGGQLRPGRARGGPVHQPASALAGDGPQPRSMTRLLRPCSAGCVGTSGSGKTTFAERLAARLEVPHLELDAVFWDAGWTRRDPDEARALITAFASSADSGWVTDGNWTTATEGLLTDADAFVWLDYPRRTVMARVVRRTLRRGVLRTEAARQPGGPAQPPEHRPGPERGALVVDVALPHPEALLTLAAQSSIPVVRLRSPREARRRPTRSTRLTRQTRTRARCGSAGWWSGAARSASCAASARRTPSRDSSTRRRSAEGASGWLSSHASVAPSTSADTSSARRSGRARPRSAAPSRWSCAQTGSRPAKYGSTYGTSSEGSCTRAKPAIDGRLHRVRQVVGSTTEARRVALASGGRDGGACRSGGALAGRGVVALELRRRCRRRPPRPPATSEMSSSQRRSVSTTRPGIGVACPS